ncbi:hypothetical protein HG535_0E04330 [Zygotorulaspora mrakii]|uniref:High osmolarity signaling protein SHO1 n=1 Tax=Zygotorulaspora mrakii TaxID=42260 RepID=A0A7H9B5V9_ZYGMR|nr:uncharacterized protein HG535_0E04330 [Zygotorulaspora mrakii]QLG73349.1 hypothetical protein HG535_0E04330 [Zygotorulaspora mrakii]
MAAQTRERAKAQRSRLHLKHDFSPSYLFSDPFAIASISIGFISWAISFAGCIATAVEYTSFPRFTWWGIAYQLLILFLQVLFYCFDIVDLYRNFLTAAIAVAFVYNTNSANNLVYNESSRTGAAAAGVILLSIIDLIWIFYYGSDNASPINRWIDSFAMGGIRPSATEDAYFKARRRSNNKVLPSKRADVTFDDGLYTETKPENYVSSTALAGFEHADPSYDSPNEKMELPATTQGNNGFNNIGNTYITDTSNGNTETTMSGTLGLYSEVGEDSFPYTARTLYSYEANTNDSYEISFGQGEILKVGDIEGRWWKAKKSTGETGIIPSNYVQLIDNDGV